jgi:phage shock protein A
MVAGLRINNSSAWAAFDKMEEKVLSMEAEAESAAMLATPDSVEQKFLALEGGSVEDELSMLKKGMITSSAASRNAESLGRPVSEVLVGRVREPVDAIDAELEALRKRARSS